MLPESLYSYLNLESTKTGTYTNFGSGELYSYLNLESTKTDGTVTLRLSSCTVT